MRLTRCLVCRKLLLQEMTTCSCGVDLAWMRAEIARLQKPSAQWRGRAPVLDIAAFRGLQPKTRRAVAAIFRRVHGR